MNHYANLEDGWINGVLSMEGPAPPGMTAIPGRQFWPVRPAPYMRARFVEGAVVWQDPRDLAQLKLQKEAEIDAWRREANGGGFMYQGRRVKTDPDSQQDIQGTSAYVNTFGTFPPDWPGGWKASGGFIPITTVAQWQSFLAAWVQRGLATFRHAQELKAQMAAATTPEALEAIQWTLPSG